ncbi:metallophosphoesterase family protein [Thiomicrorhabdus indica]|uniref:metallophosphoesterase family protein n=1 Tax=Thiomicrorhabdus indica TaxID=2267253 RepID=UPI00102DAA8D|nr:metallophosphatase domain-containing protein [Thiomicrorhabdus indica]
MSSKPLNLLHLSDTHGNYHHPKFNEPEKLANSDVIIHSGDFTAKSDNWEEIHDFLNWFSNLPVKHKILVPGNHDRAFEVFEEKNTGRHQIPDNVHLLVDESITLEGYRFYGSPYTPEFCNWAFQLYGAEDSIEKWRKVPDNIDVLITHGPAYGILDTIQNAAGKVSVGCPYLLARIEKLHQLQVHLFGHIHEANGMTTLEKVLYSNAATTSHLIKISK